MPNRVARGLLTQRRRAGLGQPVALQDQQPGGVEPLLHLAAQRRRAGDEEPDPAAHPGLDLAEHQPVGQRVLHAEQHRPAAARASRTGDALRPTPNAQSKIFALTPRAAASVITRARTFSKIRGAPAMNVGLTTAEVLDDLVDPAVDRGGEADLQLDGDQRLAEDVGQRQPQVLQVVGADDVVRLDRRAHVGPASCTSRTPLGRPVVPEV